MEKENEKGENGKGRNGKGRRGKGVGRTSWGKGCPLAMRRIDAPAFL